MVERGPEKAGVGGSIPSLGIFLPFHCISPPVIYFQQAIDLKSLTSFACFIPLHSRTIALH